MKTETREELDPSLLIREARRYLAAVDTFRAEGHEPRWLPEPGAPAPRSCRRQRLALGAPPIP